MPLAATRHEPSTGPPLDAPPESGAETERPPSDLEALFERHYDRVYRAAYRITGRSQDAEDVLQTVFLRLAKRHGELGVDSRGEASYMHRAAVNAAFDLLRARRRQRAVPLPDEDAPDELADESAGPERRQASRRMVARLREAMADLPPRSGQVFVLRFFEGYENHEIARLLEITPTAVGVALHRARGRLQEELRPLAGGLS